MIVATILKSFFFKLSFLNYCRIYRQTDRQTIQLSISSKISEKQMNWNEKLWDKIICMCSSSISYVPSLPDDLVGNLPRLPRRHFFRKAEISNKLKVFEILITEETESFETLPFLACICTHTQAWVRELFSSSFIVLYFIFSCFSHELSVEI